MRQAPRPLFGAPLRQSPCPLAALTFKLCSGQEWLVTPDHVEKRLFGILSTNSCRKQGSCTCQALETRLRVE